MISRVAIDANAGTDILRGALAMGADRGILIKAPTEQANGMLMPLSVAQLLRAVVENKGKQAHYADIACVVLGKQAIDDDLGHTGQMLSALLKWPQVSPPIGRLIWT